jgi:multicomponent Na+:H+ antiporter subunit C
MNPPSLVLVVVVAVLVTVGVYLMLERSLTRVLLGVVLAGNGVNLLILAAGGPPGGPPIVGVTPVEEMADPLPQAMVLTAIVLTLGVSAFLLAMAYRSWQLTRHDEVQDDLEDRRVARRAALDRAAYLDLDADTDPTSLEASAAEVHDETSEVDEPGDAGGSGDAGEAGEADQAEVSAAENRDERGPVEPTTPGVVGLETPETGGGR